MSLDSTIAESFQRSFDLYQDLIGILDEESLGSKLAPLPSNTLGEQLWCVVGARESYCHAIAANEWAGFSCSLESTTNKEDVLSAMSSSASAVLEVLKSIDQYSDVQNRLIVDLLEHEAAHHGQLIRYIYGLKLPIPESWKSKYALKAM